MDPRTEIARLQLEKILGGSWFSICDLESLGNILGVNVQQHHKYSELRAMHCLHYSKMSPELKAYLRDTILEVLSMEPILYMASPKAPLGEADIQQATKAQKSWLQRLLT